MHQSIQEIKNAFDQADLKCKVREVDNQWVLEAGIKGKQCSYDVLYISSDEKNNDVAVRIFGLVKYPKEKYSKALIMSNKLQSQYRFFKFTLDTRNGDFDISYDFPIETQNIGKCAVEMLIRIMKIIDDVYPDIMRSIWG